MIRMDFSLVEGAFVAKRIITILLALLAQGRSIPYIRDELILSLIHI